MKLEIVDGKTIDEDLLSVMTADARSKKRKLYKLYPICCDYAVFSVFPVPPAKIDVKGGILASGQVAQPEFIQN